MRKTNKTKGKQKKVVKGKGKVQEQPKKKVGRPSNEEIRARELAKLREANELRQQLIERQEAAKFGDAAPETLESLESDEVDVDAIVAKANQSLAARVRDPNWIPPWPVFLPGQRVSAVYDGITYKGRVGQDNVELPVIRVTWSDGSSQFAAKENLTILRKKSYRNVLRG